MATFSARLPPVTVARSEKSSTIVSALSANLPESVRTAAPSAAVVVTSSTESATATPRPAALVTASAVTEIVSFAVAAISTARPAKRTGSDGSAELGSRVTTTSVTERRKEAASAPFTASVASPTAEAPGTLETAVSVCVTWVSAVTVTSRPATTWLSETMVRATVLDPATATAIDPASGAISIAVVARDCITTSRAAVMVELETSMVAFAER